MSHPATPETTLPFWQIVAEIIGGWTGLGPPADFTEVDPGTRFDVLEAYHLCAVKWNHPTLVSFLRDSLFFQPVVSFRPEDMDELGFLIYERLDAEFSKQPNRGTIG